MVKSIYIYIYIYIYIPAPDTGTGLACCEVLPMPSCPALLSPQHLTPPPASIAHVWLNPRAMAVAETPAGMGGAVRGQGGGVCEGRIGVSGRLQTIR